MNLRRKTRIRDIGFLGEMRMGDLLRGNSEAKKEEPLYGDRGIDIREHETKN